MSKETAFRSVFFMAFVCLTIALLAPSHRLPDEVELLSDKLWHVLAFALFALLARLAFARVGVVRLGVALIAFSGLMEVLQAAMGWGRRGEWIDLGANALGICVGLALGALAARYASLRA